MVRSCGDCGLCCKLLVIPELAKPMHRWCPHFGIGSGCLQYEDRPQSCRDFDCLWRLAEIPESLSPLRTKVVLSGGIATRNGKSVSAVYCYEDVQGNAIRHFLRYFDQWFRRGHTIFVLHKTQSFTVSPNGERSTIVPTEINTEVLGTYTEVRQ